MSDGRKLMLVDAEAAKAAADTFSYLAEDEPGEHTREVYRKTALALTPQSEGGEAIDMEAHLAADGAAGQRFMRSETERDALRAEVERLREQFQTETLHSSSLHLALSDLVEREMSTHWDTPHPKACGTCRLLVAARKVLDEPVNTAAQETLAEVARLRAAEAEREREHAEWQAESDRDLAEINAMSDEQIAQQLERAGMTREESERSRRQFARLALALAQDAREINRLRDALRALVGYRSDHPRDVYDGDECACSECVAWHRAEEALK